MMPDDDEEEVLKRFGVLEQVKTGAKILALWCAGDEYSWTYGTQIPHACFDVMENDMEYCRGIVFSIADIP